MSDGYCIVHTVGAGGDETCCPHGQVLRPTVRPLLALIVYLYGILFTELNVTLGYVLPFVKEPVTRDKADTTHIPNSFVFVDTSHVQTFINTFFCSTNEL